VSYLNLFLGCRLSVSLLCRLWFLVCFVVLLCALGLVCMVLFRVGDSFLSSSMRLLNGICPCSPVVVLSFLQFTSGICGVVWLEE